MTTVEELLLALYREGISLWIEREQLCYSGPAQALTSERLAKLREHKEELLSFLRTSALARSSDAELRPRGSHGLLPASYAQRSLVGYYDRVENPAIQTVWAVKRAVGLLDEAALREAFSALVTRHAAFRTRYVWDSQGTPWVSIGSSSDFGFQASELSPYGERARTLQIAQALRVATGERFDLHNGPLLRAHLLKRHADEHVLIIAAHHSVCDVWSLAIVGRELPLIYSALARSRQPDLPPLPCLYTDHTIWLDEWLTTDSGREHIAFWRRRVAGASNPFSLPGHFPSEVPTPGLPYRREFRLRGEDLQSLRELARRERDTLSSIVLAAFTVTLARWRGHPDVFAKLVHSGRGRPQLHDIVGCFAECLLLHVDLGQAKDFREAWHCVRGAYRESLPHADVPWWKVKEELAKLPGERPLLDIHFNYCNIEIGTADDGLAEGQSQASLWLQDLDLTDVPSPHGQHGALEESAGMLLAVNCIETQSGLLCLVRYLPVRLSPGAIDAFCSSFATLLESIARRGTTVSLSECGDH